MVVVLVAAVLPLMLLPVVVAVLVAVLAVFPMVVGTRHDTQWEVEVEVLALLIMTIAR